MSYPLSVIHSDKLLNTYRTHPYIHQLTVSKAGYFPLAHNHEITRETGIDEYILIYCIDGKGWVGNPSSHTTIQKGDFILITPHISHSYGASSDNPWSILWVHFLGSEADFLVNHFYSKEPYFISSIGYQPHLVDLFHSLLNISLGELNHLNMLRSTTYLQYLLCEIIALDQLSYKQKSYFKDIRQVIYFMKHHLSSKLTLDDLAKVANLSKYHFSRKFKSYTNHSPLEYFNQLKIQRAHELLRTTDLNISEISYQLGFSSPYYFSQCFKQSTGYSPSQFKTLIQSKF